MPDPGRPPQPDKRNDQLHPAEDSNVPPELDEEKAAKALKKIEELRERLEPRG